MRSSLLQAPKFNVDTPSSWLGYSWWHLLKISHWTTKNSIRCIQKCFFILATAISGMPMPEIAPYRDSWGERSCQGALRRFTQRRWIGHISFQLWGGHSITKLSLPERNLPRQCVGVKWCYDASLGRYWGTNDTRKRIKLVFTIYRDFMQKLPHK